MRTAASCVQRWTTSFWGLSCSTSRPSRPSPTAATGGRITNWTRLTHYRLSRSVPTYNHRAVTGTGAEETDCHAQAPLRRLVHRRDLPVRPPAQGLLDRALLAP